ncbi:MAG: helix-turn-helix domain-containing protein [Tatlockia sp.]|nr:helix-turn-helix domain-containing protein [Tatlockia sp.]
MTDIADNINKLMELEGISASDLSRKTGIDRSVLHKILNGSTKNPTIGSLTALIAHYSFNEIVLGSDNYEVNEVPIFSWEEAATLRRHFISNTKRRTIKVGLNVSQNAFALIIEYTLDSRFPIGTVLIIDPEKEVKNLSYVIVKEQESQLPFMKRYVLDGSISYLKSLDPTFPSVKFDSSIFTIVGVVVQSLFQYE